MFPYNQFIIAELIKKNKQEDIRRYYSYIGEPYTFGKKQKHPPLIALIYEDSSDDMVFAGIKKAIETKTLGLKNAYGETVLHALIAKKSLAIIDLFIDELIKDCKIYSETTDGRTPLDYAVLYNRGDVMELLIKKGADVNYENSLGITSICFIFIGNNRHSVEFDKSYFNFFIRNGAKLDTLYSCLGRIIKDRVFKKCVGYLKKIDENNFGSHVRKIFAKLESEKRIKFIRKKYSKFMSEEKSKLESVLVIKKKTEDSEDSIESITEGDFSTLSGSD